MSDLVGNPEDRFSHVAAQIKHRLHPLIVVLNHCKKNKHASHFEKKACLSSGAESFCNVRILLHNYTLERRIGYHSRVREADMSNSVFVWPPFTSTIK